MSNFAIEPATDATRLRLTGEITIEHARALHAALVEHVRPGTALVLDAGALTRLDAAVLQILLAAARSASTASLEVGSPALVTACQRFAVACPFHGLPTL